MLQGGLLEALEIHVRGQLSGALATARVLAEHVGEPHSAQAQSIVESVEQTESMLGDVLEFLRAGRAGRVQVTRRRVNLRAVCERLIDSLQGRYPTHFLELDSDPRVDGQWDPDSIAAMLSRLVVNAIEHGTIGGRVRIRLRGLSDEVILEVWNAGPISADIPRHRLFEPFVRVRGPRSGPTHGLGLGLCLASAIARAHDGRMEVESDSGRGTTFRVALPNA